MTTLPRGFPNDPVGRLLLSSEMGQAWFRLASSLLFVGYLALAHVVAQAPLPERASKAICAYVLFALLWVVVVRADIGVPARRRTLSIFLDQALFAIGLYQGGPEIGPVIWAPITIAIGNGLRFGGRHGRLALVVGTVCAGTALLTSPYWHGYPMLVAGLIAAIAVVPLYTLQLSSNIQRDRDAVHARAEAFERAARTDPLTGVSNRTGFEQALRATCEQLDLAGESAAVMLVDLDGFKAINDTSGHLVGDAVLRSVAARIAETLRVTDHVGRLGGDEFGVIVRHLGSPEEVDVLAHRVLDAIAGTPLPARG
ncbi:MAG: diguanylate cyclase, partial [Burkholderiaceae bacterium]